jgi:hypothetical protein
MLLALAPAVCADTRSEIDVAILSYLLDNPDAEDTVKGIADWWLLRRTIRHQTQAVNDALVRLAARGFLLKRSSAGSRTHFRINKDREADIARFLKEAAETPNRIGDPFMTVKLANRAKHLVIVPLNSGDTIHLAPHETSRPIEEVEIQHNGAVEKLVRGNFIALTGSESEPRGHSAKSMEHSRRKEKR